MGRSVINMRVLATTVTILLAVVVGFSTETTAYRTAEKLSTRSSISETRKMNRYSNAYATMMYMGTPRDYEYYVATRVLIRSLKKLRVEADTVVIASLDVPLRWVQAMEQEDGARVVRVENLNNPYMIASDHNRFKRTLNKLYAWNLVDYDRVVMLDADNLFLQKTDELFQCGEFCAVFINPCIFHTGLFVLQPSEKVFKNLLHEVENRRQNRDGADQGFLVSYFSDLLDRPMFHPPANTTKLEGTFRLPLGYQMDASYYYLKLRWSVPCGPNSVITFPSAVWFKPWYWWSWPILPLGLSWHEQRRNTLGYVDEIPAVVIQTIVYLSIWALTQIARPKISKICYRPAEKSTSLSLAQLGFKFVALWLIVFSYIIPFVLIPCTVHPTMGWGLYLLGSSALCSVAAAVFGLPMISVLSPCIAFFGALLVMAYPYYPDGIYRALSLFGYAFCCAPVMWSAVTKVTASLTLEREIFLPKVGESLQLPEFNKAS